MISKRRKTTTATTEPTNQQVKRNELPHSNETATQRWKHGDSENTRAVLLQTALVFEPGVLLKAAARNRGGTQSASRRIAGSKSGRNADVLLQAAPVVPLQAAKVTFKRGDGVPLKTASRQTTGGRIAGSEPARIAV